MDMLRVERLYVRKGTFLLQDVNLSVEEGAVHAIAGKGGSGRSTLIQAIGGAIVPTAGRIMYNGREMYEDECSIRKMMSVIYDAPNFNMELTPERLVRELLRFEPWFDRESFLVNLQLLELNPKLRVRLYSEGMQRMLMLVIALCRQPKLLVMDELTSGVDKESGTVMWDMLGAYRKEHSLTVLFTTHHEEELSRADHVWRMAHGCMEEKTDEKIL